MELVLFILKLLFIIMMEIQTFIKSFDWLQRKIDTRSLREFVLINPHRTFQALTINLKWSLDEVLKWRYVVAGRATVSHVAI